MQTKVWDLIKVSTNEILCSQALFRGGGGGGVIAVFIVGLFVLVSVLKLSVLQLNSAICGST